MADHPILFKSEMIRAILDGRKNQTRRVAKLQDRDYSSWGKEAIDAVIRSRCPYGVPGDLLWVRETWRAHEEFADAQIPYLYRADYPEGLDVKWKPSIHMPKDACRLWLKVKSIRVERVQEISRKNAIAEGVNLDEHDITCMGDCANRHCDKIGDKTLCDVYHTDADCPETEAFGMLWDSINAKRGYGWEVNPWVWIVEFERHEQ